ncbi:endolytic transglycosylase MltG [Geobacillus thermoleovorans]|uniref:endolytic transglycosylase MltG n=1 Tax=Geobacillus thermoleovorans TaxID=33941 RepID=UPI0020455D98|nr:endolytic transglycosylase MltG [Geobacillus thermoleovorans]UPT60119.1 endolytic transglycosylase MltG [Geobacillus thermoleovorans]
MKQNDFRAPEARLVRKIVLIVCAVLLAAFVIAGASSFLYIRSALKPVDPNDRTPVHVSIPIGSSAAAIAEQLEQKRLIKSAAVFRLYVRWKNESGFQAGEYELTRAMPMARIIELLKTGKSLKIGLKLTVPEGSQLVQIADLIAAKTGYKQEQIMKLLNDRAYIERLMKMHPDLLTDDIFRKGIRYPLEGYLFPATYVFADEKPPLSEIIEAMVAKTAAVLDTYKAAMKEKNMSPHQLLTMSSLIEEEATEKADRQKIASVFYNRLHRGMPLQTDPTVLYALGEHKERVLYKDLQVNSPYNTYMHKGLPPGPIANAGVMSIEAALEPAATDYLYFLATPGGEVIFTKTLAEHNREKAKHIGKQ